MWLGRLPLSMGRRPTVRPKTHQRPCRPGPRRSKRERRKGPRSHRQRQHLLVRRVDPPPPGTTRQTATRPIRKPRIRTKRWRQRRAKPSKAQRAAGRPGGTTDPVADASASDTSAPEAENPYETLAATPGEAEQSTSSGQEPQFELSPDAPIEVLDESAVQSEEPLQSIHQRIDSTASTARAAQSAAPRSSMQAAWLRAMMEQPQGALTTAAGWSSLTIKLDDTDGTMTVEARRDERHVAVQVSFSDPNLRSIAAQNIERLEAALRQQYDASVDLSLTSDGQGGGEEKQTSGSRPLHRHNAAQDSSTAVKTARSVPLGATREWVG